MPVTGTVFSDTTAVAGTAYYYVMTGACDASGLTESGSSGELSASKSPTGSACDDGNVCTDGDSCQSGACVAGAPVSSPGGTSGLAFDSASDLNWAATAVASGYDVIRGTLSTLSAGGFASATDLCVGSHVANTFISDTHVPAEGDGDWFLIRAYGTCGTGSYDDGSPSQAGSRDPGVTLSPNACP
jgi:hypothetical protein